MNAKDTSRETFPRESDIAAEEAARPDLRDPQIVLSFLEADQIVAAKQRTRFGQRRLSAGKRLIFWALRIYVILMFVLVLISFLRAIHSSH